MEIQKENTKQSPPPIKWDDEIDFENFEYKVLDDGLGFHQEKLEVSELSKERPSVRDRGNFDSTQRKSQIPESFISLDSGALPNSLGHAFPLTPQRKILGHQKADKESKNTGSEKKVIKLKLANIESRILAYVIDLFLVSLLFGGFLGLGVFLSGAPIDFVATQFQDPINSLLLVVLFTLAYLIYFSVADCDSSLGKKALSLKVLDQKGRSITLTQSLMRSILSLCFLPLLFDWQNDLSGTKVFKR